MAYSSIDPIPPECKYQLPTSDPGQVKYQSITIPEPPLARTPPPPPVFGVPFVPSTFACPPVFTEPLPPPPIPP